MKPRHNPNQLAIDFTIPAVKSLTVRDISQAVGISTSKIYAEILEGRLAATSIAADVADRDEWRIPLQNYIAWLNNEYNDQLLYRFPAREWLSVPRVARFLNCSEPHVVTLTVRDGEFPHYRNLASTGKRRRLEIPLIDLVAFCNRRTAGAIA